MSSAQRSPRGMDVEDADIAWAERDADPDRARDYDPNDQLQQEYTRLHTEYDARHPQLSQSESRREAVEEVEEPEQIEELEDPTRSGEGPHGTPNETGSISSSMSSGRREEIRGQAGGARGQPRSRQYSSAPTLTATSTRMERMLMEYIDRHPTAIERIEGHRLQHMQTVGGTSKARAEGYELPSFGAGKPYPPPLPEREEYVVEFDGHDDPRHAMNFPMKTKILIAVILVYDSLAATFASSIFSAATEAVGEHFHVGREVVTLGTSLFVLGYAVGPIVFAPISELYGRRLPIAIGAFGFAIFNTAVAVAKDYQTVVISRFFAGFFGSCPLTLCGAVFADMFNNEVRSCPCFV